MWQNRIQSYMENPVTGMNAPTRGITTASTGHGELILVIDDEEALLDMARMVLERRGYEVLTAQNALEGIAQFKENLQEIKLIITDAAMSYLNGLEIIYAIKELKPDISVILASGCRGDTTVRRKMALLHLQCLEKPYSLDQLLSAVKAGLQD